jgi:hypothetical protein
LPKKASKESEYVVNMDIIKEGNDLQFFGDENFFEYWV